MSALKLITSEMSVLTSVMKSMDQMIQTSSKTWKKNGKQPELLTADMDFWN